MSSLWFIVPAHGRLELAAICLRQLRRTCDALTAEGVEATAVVIAEDENLDTARELGFGTVERNNRFLSRRFNDGIQFALDPDYNPRPADFVVPFGSDDWADHRLFLDLPPPNGALGFQAMSFVREDGLEITASNVSYVGGCGIRVYPRQLMAKVGYRPADEDRPRGCDTSIFVNLQKRHGGTIRFRHGNTDARQIVDWKSPADQLNSYEAVGRWRGRDGGDPFETLAGVFPDEALREMAAHYARVRDREMVTA